MVAIWLCIFHVCVPWYIHFLTPFSIFLSIYRFSVYFFLIWIDVSWIVIKYLYCYSYSIISPKRHSFVEKLNFHSYTRSITFVFCLTEWNLWFSRSSFFILQKQKINNVPITVPNYRHINVEKCYAARFPSLHVIPYFEMVVRFGQTWFECIHGWK